VISTKSMHQAKFRKKKLIDNQKSRKKMNCFKKNELN